MASRARRSTRGLSALAASAVVLGGVAAAASAGTTGSLSALDPAASSGGSGSLGSLGRPTPPVNYVALGDSYASGAGIQPTVAGSPAACSRSTQNYPHVVAAELAPASFVDVSCGGATTHDLAAPQGAGIPPQLDAVTPATTLVTLTVGGNDGGVFGTAAGECARTAAATGDYTGSPCRTRFGSRFSNEIAGSTGPAVTASIAAVKAKAPAARVVVVGYSRILPPTPDPTCQRSMPYALGDMTYMDGVEADLNAALRTAAAATGAMFVDMAGPSTGHDACAGPERWVEPLVAPVGAAAVHPNATGERAIGRTVLAALRG